PVNARAIEQEIAAEPRLAAERDRVLALRHALNANLPGQAVPSELRKRIEASLGLGRRRFYIGWNAIAASLTAAVIVLAASGYFLLGRGGETSLMQELTASHARALIAARVTDVASSDQHTIKPWFSTRTAQAPRVADLGAAGFALIGGRLDVVQKIP